MSFIVRETFFRNPIFSHLGSRPVSFYIQNVSFSFKLWCQRQCNTRLHIYLFFYPRDIKTSPPIPLILQDPSNLPLHLFTTQLSHSQKKKRCSPWKLLLFLLSLFWWLPTPLYALFQPPIYVSLLTTILCSPPRVAHATTTPGTWPAATRMACSE